MVREKKKIFCVIPAYNEEHNIAKVIGEVESLVDCLVVVVDGASDKTYEKAIEER
ncbi:glycosyltransferase family 2 protein, partial [Candidatus Parcubacteria bacterium]